MGPYMKMFLLYGTIFAVVGLVLDAIKDNADYYWWVDVIGDYAVGALAAFLWYRHSKRNA